MMGPSTDGTGWVNNNNTCKGDDCDQRMPLPESHGKHCAKCGTRVLTWKEMQDGLNPKTTSYLPVCNCAATKMVGDKFCNQCGGALVGFAGRLNTETKWRQSDG